MLALRDVSAGYGAVDVLSDIDLDVRPGEWLAIVGAAAAGKTTLMRTIAGVLEPSEGTIHLEGEDLASVPARSLDLFRERCHVFRVDSSADQLERHGHARVEFEDAIELF